MLPSVLALVVWLAVGARVAAEPGSSRALLGGALVRGAGAPAAGAYPYASDFNLNASAATPFARRLLSAARDESNKQRIAFAGDGDIVPLEVQRALCEGFLRGVDAAATFVTEDVDETYAAAFPLHAGGLLPVGCVEGCIIGNGLFENIARFYGIARTLTPSSWRGKCFSEERVASNAAAGVVVRNRIKVNYGPFVNRLLGLEEPLALYEGKARHGDSWFNASEDALVVEYDVTEHEFSGFRDELREIYPGLYVGKMYATPGASLWNGAFVVPAGEPAFAVHFALFAEPNGEVMSAVRQSV